jgi:signal transduction histidine kinase
VDNRDTMAEGKALEREVERLREENAAFRVRISELEVMQEVARSLSSELNLEPLLQLILRSAVQVMDASAGSLLLLDRETNELVFEVIEGGSGSALEKTRMPADKGIAGWVASHGEPLIVDDVNRDNRYYRSISEELGYTTRSILCVPMIAKRDVIGVLQLLNKVEGRYFTLADQEMLTAFAAQSAVSIDNARLYEDLRGERDRILAVEEDVSHGLARDLHDGPAQMLAAIIMSANFAKAAMERGSSPLALSELNEMVPVAEKALHQVRTLLFDLRPVLLETRGLVPALESYARRLRESEGLDVALNVEGDYGRLSHKADLAVYSVVQEAINNARKHAQAGRVDIGVKLAEEDCLVVIVRDDGIGFDVDRVSGAYDERESLGMLSMKERAEVVHGKLSISSHPGEGTSVTLRLPLTPNLA